VYKLFVMLRTICVDSKYEGSKMLTWFIRGFEILKSQSIVYTKYYPFVYEDI
jgi:hypothetical protein